jgi:hypothetical protein
MKYPVGILVDYDGLICRTSDDTLYPLISWEAALSWGQPILPGNQSVLDAYEVSTSKIGFRPGSVIRSAMTDKTYFIEGPQKRLIISVDFWNLGFNDFETQVVAEDDILWHEDGEVIA